MPSGHKQRPSPRIALTGFMGVGKSSVARHLSGMTGYPRVDLDQLIEDHVERSIARLIEEDGIEGFRRVESEVLELSLKRPDIRILSLGGGTWMSERNRQLLRDAGFTTLWLDGSFKHCWLNISRSKKKRPLAQDKDAALRLYDERQKFYCLADWHFVVRPGATSYSIASQIRDEIFS